MSVLDMPIEELKKYRGTNPRPADFDAYWEKALKEMHSVEPDVELIPADFQVWYADCYDMYFTGVRNARIYAKFIIPKKRKEKMPAILMFPELEIGRASCRERVWSRICPSIFFQFLYWHI